MPRSLTGADTLHLEHDLARGHGRLVDALEHLAADHQLGQVALGLARGGYARGGDHAAAHDRDAVGDGQDLVELVADEDDRRARGGHAAQRLEELVDLLGREDGRGLVHDEDVGAAVEHLEDLHALLLADRELPDLGRRVDRQAGLLGQGPDLGLVPWQVHPEARLIEAEQDVLGDGQ